MRFAIVALSLIVVGSARLGSAGEMLKAGDAFPAWELKDHTSTKVSSTDLAGKTYLLWYYPKAMTSGCTAEGCAMRDNFDGFKKAGVQIFGISFDAPAKNAEFVAKEHFPFRLLSDDKKELAAKVGATSTLWPVAKRISYLVGPDGKVLKAYADVKPAKHAEEVLSDLAALKK